MAEDRLNRQGWQGWEGKETKRVAVAVSEVRMVANIHLAAHVPFCCVMTLSGPSRCLMVDPLKGVTNEARECFAATLFSCFPASYSPHSRRHLSSPRSGKLAERG